MNIISILFAILGVAGRMMLLLVCLFAAISSSASAQSSGSTHLFSGEDEDDNFKIKVLGLFPTNASDAAIAASQQAYFTEGVVIQTAVEMALEDISNTENLLPGYDLELQAVDSGCDVGKSSFHLAEEAFRPDTTVVVLGPQCNAPVQLIGQMVNEKTNLITVSYGARATALSDSSKYRSLFRTVSPTSELNKGVYGLLVKFGWERVCVGVRGENAYIDLAEDFFNYAAAQSSNFTVHMIHVVTERNVEFFTNSFCRVFIIFAGPAAFPFVLYSFHGLNLTGRNFQTIFVEEVDEVYSHYQPHCPVSTVLEAAQSSLVVHFQDTDQASDQHNSYEDNLQHDKVFKDNLNERVLHEVPYQYLSQGNYDIAAAAYDGMWAIALGLNASIEPLAKNHYTLKDYLPFSNASIREIIIKEFEKLSFHGVYKPVEFTENRHFPVETVTISQFQGYKFVPVAIYDSNVEALTVYGNESFTWIGSDPPSDRPRVIEVDVPKSAHLVMVAITALGLLLCLAFFIFNCYFRKNRIIKASSPNMNSIIIIGCSLVFVSVTSFTFETYHEIPDRLRSYFCNATLWTSMCGFTLCFGALTLKTWRVYRIFKNPWSRKRIYRDSSLYYIIAGMLVIDLFILVLMAGISPLQSFEIEMHTVEYTYTVLLCIEQEYTIIFIAAIIIYKILVLAFAAFLAVQTRNIKSKAFNDSKFISWAIYMVVLTSLIGLPMAIFTGLGSHLVLAFYCTSITITLYGFIILLTVFMPKVIVLFQTRKEKITSVVASTANTATYERRSSAYYRKNREKPEKLRKSESSLSVINE